MRKTGGAEGRRDGNKKDMNRYLGDKTEQIEGGQKKQTWRAVRTVSTDHCLCQTTLDNGIACPNPNLLVRASTTPNQGEPCLVE
jgi:hypothetical protein